MTNNDLRARIARIDSDLELFAADGKALRARTRRAWGKIDITAPAYATTDAYLAWTQLETALDDHRAQVARLKNDRKGLATELARQLHRSA